MARIRRLPAPRVSRANRGGMRTAAAILMAGLLASPAAPQPSGVRPDGDAGRRGDSESTGTPTLPRQRGGNLKAVYFCPHKGQLSATDLAAHPGIVVATKFDQVRAAASKLVAIWIDKDAIRDVDLEWLHKPPQKYYPIVVVGYRSALYSFRDALSGFGIHGPPVEWQKVKLSPGFSVWMLISKTATGTSSIMRGYDVAPTVAGILKVTTPLLEESMANETVPWGKVSNGLQCRLSPATQTVTVAQGAKPHDIEVHVSYDLRNAGDAALRFSPTGTPLWGQSHFEVTGPDGRKVRYIGVKSEVRPPVPPAVLAPGETLRRKVRLEYDFTHPGKYLVSTRKESAPDGPEVMAYYGGDRKKALANPDRVWTGSLLSNPVTVVSNPVTITVERGAPGTGLPLSDALTRKFAGLGNRFAFVAVCRALDAATIGPGVEAVIERPQRMAVTDVLAGRAPPSKRISLSYSCMHGSPVEERERLIWIVRRRHDGTWFGIKALPVTATNIEMVVDAVQGKKRWGRPANGIRAGIQCKAMSQKPGPEAVLVLSVRNVGTRPVRLLGVGQHWGRSRPIEVTVDGKAYPFRGPKVVPPPPPRVEDYIELAPGAVDSGEVRLLAVNWGLRNFRGAEVTFVYANDSATAIASPFDRDTQKWQQVTGLWTGTARSGAVTLSAAQAHERNASSVQTDARHPGPAPEHLALLPAYLGGNKDARIRDPGVLRWADIGLKRINTERHREPDKQPQLIPQEAAR